MYRYLGVFLIGMVVGAAPCLVPRSADGLKEVPAGGFVDGPFVIKIEIDSSLDQETDVRMHYPNWTFLYRDQEKAKVAMNAALKSVIEHHRQVLNYGKP